MVKNLVKDQGFAVRINLEDFPDTSPEPVAAVAVSAEKYGALFEKCSELLAMLEVSEEELPSPTTEILGDILRLEGEIFEQSII